MTVNQAVEQLLEVEEKRQGGLTTKTTIGVGLSRVGSDDQQVVAGTLEELLTVDFGQPLHSFVLPGKMHILEAEMLETFAINKETFKQYAEVHH